MKVAVAFVLEEQVNGGVLIAGALVAWPGRRWPDLLVGPGVVAIAMEGEILRDAR